MVNYQRSKVGFAAEPASTHLLSSVPTSTFQKLASMQVIKMLFPCTAEHQKIVKKDNYEFPQKRTQDVKTPLKHLIHLAM